MLTPVFSDVPVPMFREACMPRVRRPGSVGSKIEVLTGRCDWPAVEHRAVSKVRTAANRGLREREGTCHGERGRQNDCLEFHCLFPSVARKKNKDERVWLLDGFVSMIARIGCCAAPDLKSKAAQ